MKLMTVTSGTLSQSVLLFKKASIFFVGCEPVAIRCGGKRYLRESMISRLPNIPRVARQALTLGQSSFSFDDSLHSWEFLNNRGEVRQDSNVLNDSDFERIFQELFTCL